MPKKLEQYSNFRYVDAERKLAVCNRELFRESLGFLELLKREGFHVIAIDAPIEKLKKRKVPYTIIGEKFASFYDTMRGERVPREIFEVIEEIHSRLRKGKLVIVCPGGLFTSPTIAASYLAIKKRYTIEDAVNAATISASVRLKMLNSVEHSVQKYNEFKALRREQRLGFLKKLVPKWSWFRRKPKPK